jgi:hypothetical protein
MSNFHSARHLSTNFAFSSFLKRVLSGTHGRSCYSAVMRHVIRWKKYNVSFRVTAA